MNVTLNYKEIHHSANLFKAKSLTNSKKTCLVTGAGTGIGLAITKKLLSESYHVIAHYNSSNDHLKELQSEFSQLTSIQEDFSSPQAGEKLFSKIEKPIDILINNAGILPTAKEFINTDYSDVIKTFEINFFSAMQLCQKVIPHMKTQNWGRIVNISSIGVKFAGNQYTMAYNLSKSCLEQLTESLNKSYAVDNVLTNTIRVGVTDTDLHKRSQHKNMDKRVKMIPLKRMGKPEEVADLVTYLISDKANFISGQTIAVAGGE